MGRKRIVAVTLAAVLASLAAGTETAAQQASGIAGVVRDTSGAVLPGVTVEAASPALIEQVRAVITDAEGRYNVTDLRPGTYAVTFTLPGFSTFRRDGIALSGGFTATVNAVMQIGALEETITVSGAAPLVDTQSARQQTVVAYEVLETLPTSTKGMATFANMIPGMSGTVDVGGSQGTYSSNSPRTNLFHGKSGVKLLYDGMRVNNMVGGGDSTGFMISPATVAEVQVETGGVTAESPASGVAMNAIPKEGSNTLSVGASGVFSNDSLQSGNLTDDLRARGLTTVNAVVYLYDSDATVGGPIKQDKLWFFAAGRASGSKNQIAGLFWNKTQGTPLYTPDPERPADPYERLRSAAVRLTWQVSGRDKINIFTDVQTNCTCGRTGFVAPEGDTQRRFWPQGLFQVSWTSVANSKLLFEAGASATISHWPTRPTTPAINPSDPLSMSIVEQSTGLRYNAASSYTDPQDSDRFAQRASVSYVTGSHVFKAGVQIEEGLTNSGVRRNQDMEYRFLNGVPNRVTLFSTPYLMKNRMKADLGLFVQDQWTIRRLTINAGLRYDYFNAFVPAQHVPATRFVPVERNFDPVHGVPLWHDLNPRLGGAYDIFGNGRTALKASFGRYLGVQGLAIANANNPINTTVNSVNRTWSDANRNFVPDCDLLDPAANGECGRFSDESFGQQRVTTRYAEDAIRGWGARDHFWDFSTEIQHELLPGTSVSAGYYRNWHGNFLVTDNLAVSPTDYDPFCVTAPADPRLPGGGGYEVCGLYDVNPAKFGQSDSVVTQAANFGEQTRASDFFAVTFASRFGSGARLGGGIDTGRTVEDSCFVVDSPQQLLNCRVVRPFAAQTQFKLNGSYPLPGDIVLSAVFQNMAGPEILAEYPATNAEIAPSLGRTLAAGRNATAVVPLIAPMTQFEGRRTQVDVRVSKDFRLTERMRVQANFDLYNVLNASSILMVQGTYGAQWLRPIGEGNTPAVLPARLAQFSARLTF